MAGAHRDLIQLQSGELNRPVYNQKGHILFGAVLASLLEWACLAMPKWPLHPIGLIMVNTFYANEAWVSVFFGWLAKVLVLKYGGARLYRKARPMVAGLIMGEVLAAVFWAIVPVVLVLLDKPYMVVKIQPF